MEPKNFCQICLAFLILILSVLLFSIFEIELSFITTFLFTIFTISISIFFYNESTKSTNLIKDLLIELKGDVKNLNKQNKIIEDLNTSDTYITDRDLRRDYGKNK